MAVFALIVPMSTAKAESINTLSNTLVIAGTERLSSRVLQSNFHIMPVDSLLPGNSISMVRLTWHAELCLHSSVGLIAGEGAPAHPLSKGSVVSKHHLLRRPQGGAK